MHICPDRSTRMLCMFSHTVLSGLRTVQTKPSKSRSGQGAFSVFRQLPPSFILNKMDEPWPSTFCESIWRVSMQMVAAMAGAAARSRPAPANAPANARVQFRKILFVRMGKTSKRFDALTERIIAPFRRPLNRKTA